jgi:hypothetical protein
MPELSSLQTSLPGVITPPFEILPLQQSCFALMLPRPPSGSGTTGAPQMFPTGLQAFPLLQVPELHSTSLIGSPPPQQLAVSVHQVPVSRQPSAAWQTVTPEPGSVQKREQQLLPPLHGSPAWVQLPPPPPVTSRQWPTPPSLLAEQACPQHSSLLRQISSTAWQEYALAQKPLWQFVEQQSLASMSQDWPITLQLPPARLAQVPPSHVPVQQSFPALQDWPTSLQILSEHVPLTQLFRQQSVLLLQDSPFA